MHMHEHEQHLLEPVNHGHGAKAELGAKPPHHCGLQVILRKLFERLGATYIKLGQFIASAPSLFPPEYVSEFQVLPRPACPAHVIRQHPTWQQHS